MNFQSLVSQLLCPPGNGVHTVNTAKERKQTLHETLFNTSDDNVLPKWEESLNNINSHDGTVLFGITSDCGGGIQRGANWGPLYLRNTLLKNHREAYLSCFDIGDTKTIPHLLHDKYLNQETIGNCRKAIYGSEEIKLPVSPLSIAEEFSKQFYSQNKNQYLLTLGGDHSVSYPIVKSYLQHKKAQGKRVGLIHFDAHTDLLKERLGIDLCFGSWTYHIMDDLVDSTDLYQIGIRSSGKDRNHWESSFNINQYWNYEVKDKSPQGLAKEIAKDLKSKGIDEIYISFDIDAIDARYASATGTPEKDGLEPHDCHLIIDTLCNDFKLTGADLVEVAPLVRYPEANNDPTFFAKEPDMTLQVAAQLIESFIRKMNKN